MTTWGAIRGKEGRWKGRNELGRLLMRLRDEFQGELERAEDSAAVPTEEHATLAAAALAARERAYAPYSGYQVGAAVLTDQGQIIAGCNVENASYGLSNCAERTAIFAAVAGGARAIHAVAVATDDGGTPCGACRQVLSEFAPKEGSPLTVLLLDRAGAIVRETTLRDLLPDAFTLS